MRKAKRKYGTCVQISVIRFFQGFYYEFSDKEGRFFFDPLIYCIADKLSHITKSYHKNSFELHVNLSFISININKSSFLMDNIILMVQKQRKIDYHIMVRTIYLYTNAQKSPAVI